MGSILPAYRPTLLPPYRPTALPPSRPTFRAMQTIHRLSVATAALAYVLIVLGGIVRITGSGLGCGDDWPLCNGRLIPPLDDIRTLIEYTHRLVAALLSVLVVGLAVLAVLKRSQPGLSGPGNPLRAALLALVLLITQVLLGAVTVWLELSAWVVVLHLGTALALLATLVVLALRAGQPISSTAGGSGSDRSLGKATLAAGVLVALTLLLGGLTANLGAGAACQGFPLCSGQIWPSGTGSGGSGGSGLAHVHWIHRLAAYALMLYLLWLALTAHRTSASRPLRVATWAAVGLAASQVAVAAVMVLAGLPPLWRVAHVAVGSALWVTLVYATWLAMSRSKEEI